jgi:branched-subunit amino acid transport protein AzlD
MALLLAWLFGRVKSSTTFKGFKLLLEIAFVVQRALFKKNVIAMSKSSSK